MNMTKVFVPMILTLLCSSPAFSASWLECNGDSGKKLRWGRKLHHSTDQYWKFPGRKRPAGSSTRCEYY